MLNIFKKKTLQTEKIDDDFKLDDDLDFGDFSFDTEPPPDNRSPVTKFASGFFSGVKDTVTSADTIRDITLDAMPEPYRQTYDLYRSIDRTVKQTYEDATKELKPVVKDIKRLTTKLIPQDSKFVPKRILEAIDDWRKEESEGVISKQEQQNAHVSNMLADVFKAQIEQSESEQQTENNREQVKSVIDKSRFENNFAIFNEINKHLARIDDYQSGVNLGFQKKSLELQARSLFAQQDIAETSIKTLAVLNKALPDIIKNTGLPDFQKINKVELFKDVSGRKFADTIGKRLFGDASSVIQDTLGNFSKRIKEKVIATRDTLGMALSGADMVSGMQGMEGGPTKTEMAGNAAGSLVSGIAAKEFMDSQKEKIMKNEKVAKGATFLENFLTKLPNLITGFKQDAARSDSWWKEQVADLIPSQTKAADLNSLKAGEYDSAGLFTKQTNLSITEIIPGYLARILREIQVFRTGNESIDLTVYDPVKRSFSESKSVFKRLIRSIIRKEDEEIAQKKTQALIDKVDPEKKLSEEARKMVSDRLVKGSGKRQRVDSYNYGFESDYGKGDAAKEAAQFMKAFAQNLGKDKKTETDFYRDYNNLNSRVRDIRGEVELLNKIGFRDQLIDSGLVKQDEHGNESVDLEHYSKILQGREKLDKPEPQTAQQKPANTGMSVGAMQMAKPRVTSTPVTANKRPVVDKKEKRSIISYLLETFDPKMDRLLLNTEKSEAQNDTQQVQETKDVVSVTPTKTKREQKLVLTQPAKNKTKSGLNYSQSILSYLTGKHDPKMDQLLLNTEKMQTQVVFADPSIQTQKPIEDKPDWREKLFSLFEQNNKDTTASREHLKNIEDATFALHSKNIDMGSIKTMVGKKRAGFESFLEDIKSKLTKKKQETETKFDELKDKLRKQQEETELNFGPGLKGWMARMAYKGSELTERAVKKLPSNVVKAKDKVNAVVSGIKDKAFGTYKDLKRFDIYYKDEKSPRIYYDKLIRGHYRLKDSGKVIRSLKDITGEVIDDNGNVVIAKDDIQFLFVKYDNKIVPFLKETKQKLTDFGWNAIKSAPDTFVKTLKTGNKLFDAALSLTVNTVKTVFGLVDEPFDVHIPGEKNNPVMLATIWRNGGYYSKKTGKAIYKPSQIDGEVLDDKGNIVLTTEMLKKGLHTPSGKLYKSPKAKILGAIGKAKDLTLKALTAGKDIVASTLGVLKEIPKAILGKMGGLGMFGGAKKVHGVLVEIRDILDTRLPQPGEKRSLKNKPRPTQQKQKQDKEPLSKKDSLFLSVLNDIKTKLTKPKANKSDLDGDGDRDNSWLDQKAQRMKALKEKVVAAPGKLKEKIAEKKDGMLETLGKLGTIASTVFSGLKGVVAAGGMIGGFLSKAGGLLKFLGKSGGMLARAGLFVGGLGVKTAIGGTILAAKGVGAIAVGAGSALLGALSSPVVLGAAAVGLAGYAAYKAYKHFSSEKMTPINRLRYIQYGYAKNDEDNESKILSLEDYMLTCVGDNSKGPDIAASKVNLEKVTDIMGLDYKKDSDLKMFVDWFKARFKPVFLTHLASIKALRGEYKLKDLDKLKPKDLKAYLQAVSFQEGPYDYTKLPFEMPKGYKVSNGSDVTAYLKELTAAFKLENVVATKTGDLAKKTAIISAAAASTAIAVKYEPNKEETDPTSPAAKAAKVFPSSTIASAAVLAEMQTSQIKALDAARYKTYGIEKLDANCVKAYIALEKTIKPLLTFSPQAKAVYQASTPEIREKIQGLFGLDDHKKKVQWLNWFENRFLPLYLDFQSQFYAKTNKAHDGVNGFLLKPQDELDIVLSFKNSKYWSTPLNGFTDTPVNKDPSSIEENIEFIKKSVKQKELEQQSAKPTKVEQAKQEDKAIQEKADPKPSSMEPPKAYDKADPFSTKPAPTTFAKPDESKVAPADAEPKPKMSSVTTTDTQPTANKTPTGLKVAAGPAKQVTDTNFLKVSANTTLQGLNPALSASLKSAAHEYGEKTGKSLTVTQAFRSSEQQAELHRKNPSKAAAPGKSLHEFGLAIDADSKTLNEMDELGILRKYGLTRPVGSEPWHVEPIGTQFNLNKYKENPSAAEDAVESGLGRGGSGVGTLGGNKVYRDVNFSKKIFESSTDKVVSEAPKEISTGVPSISSSDMSKPPVIPEKIQTAAKAEPVRESYSKKSASLDGMTDDTEVTSKAAKETYAKKSPDLSGLTDDAEPKPKIASSGVIDSQDNKNTRDFINSSDLYKKEETKVASSAPQKTGFEVAKPPQADVPSNPNAQMPDKQPKTKQEVIDTIKTASSKVGVDENTVLATAAVESGLNPNAKANTSSAAGLFQFIDSTWQAMLKKYGKNYGYVAGQTPATDARANALMGAHYIKDNIAQVKTATGKAGPTEAYMAHFLGPGGAKQFFTEMQKNPDSPAAKVMPKAAGANKPIFMKGGQERSFKEIYDLMTNKLKSRAEGLGLKLDFGGLGLKAPASQGTSLAAPGEGSSGVGLKAPAASSSAVPNTSVKTSDASSTNMGTENPYGLTDSKPRLSPDNPAVLQKRTTTEPAAYSRSPEKQSRVIESITSPENPLAESTIGFSPKQITSQPKGADNLMGSEVMLKTEELLAKSVEIETNMLDVLKQIFGIVSKGSSQAGSSQSNNQRQTSYSNNNTNSIQEGAKEVENTSRSVTNAARGVTDTFKAAVSMRRAY